MTVPLAHHVLAKTVADTDVGDTVCTPHTGGSVLVFELWTPEGQDSGIDFLASSWFVTNANRFNVVAFCKVSQEYPDQVVVVGLDSQPIRAWRVKIALIGKNEKLDPERQNIINLVA
ncbi:hypothetical protein FQN55_000487 [Onygenales sp. PD_40]|nr:hypothetical protein FQN55_000487 [Onygenales sp. PD_40]